MVVGTSSPDHIVRLLDCVGYPWIIKGKKPAFRSSPTWSRCSVLNSRASKSGLMACGAFDKPLGKNQTRPLTADGWLSDNVNEEAL